MSINTKIEKLKKRIEAHEIKKIELEEKKNKLERQIKEQNDNISDIRKEIKQLEKEKQTLELQDLLHVMTKKGIAVNELKHSILSGDLLELQEKIEQSGNNQSEE